MAYAAWSEKFDVEVTDATDADVVLPPPPPPQATKPTERTVTDKARKYLCMLASLESSDMVRNAPNIQFGHPPHVFCAKYIVQA